MEFTSIAKGLNTTGFGEEVKSEDQGLVYSSVLEKGILTDAFMHNTNMRFSRKGSDVKASLAKIIPMLDKEIIKEAKELEKCLSKCDAKPSGMMNDYHTKGLNLQIKSIPKVFTYNQIEECVKDTKVNYEDCPYRKYNRKAHQYIQCCVEKIIASTLMSGLDDDRNLYLTVKESAGLGL